MKRMTLKLKDGTQEVLADALARHNGLIRNLISDCEAEKAYEVDLSAMVQRSDVNYLISPRQPLEAHMTLQDCLRLGIIADYMDNAELLENVARHFVLVQPDKTPREVLALLGGGPLE